MTILRVLAAAFVVAIFSGGAFATPIPKGGVTIDDIADVMRAMGEPVEIQADTRGAPAGTKKIRSTHNGIVYYVYTFECRARCISIQFATGWDMTSGMTTGQMNNWNARWRYGRAFVDDQGDPWVEMDVDVERGSSTESIANNFERWFTVMDDFNKFLDSPAV